MVVRGTSLIFWQSWVDVSDCWVASSWMMRIRVGLSITSFIFIIVMVPPLIDVINENNTNNGNSQEVFVKSETGLEMAFLFPNGARGMDQCDNPRESEWGSAIEKKAFQHSPFWTGLVDEYSKARS